jgi:predicted nicotinamide N-methyase
MASLLALPDADAEPSAADDDDETAGMTAADRAQVDVFELYTDARGAEGEANSAVSQSDAVHAFVFRCGLEVQVAQRRELQLELGQTGGCVWDAACVLLQFLDCDEGRAVRAHLEAAGSVLELGSGTGLCGLGIAASGWLRPAASVLLTDQDSCMRLLRANAAAVVDDAAPRLRLLAGRGDEAAAAAAESPSPAKGRRSKGKGKGGGGGGATCPSVCVERLEWGCDSVGTFDVVVAADCVFNEHLAGDLVAALRDHTAQQGVALVAFELRSHEVMLAFFEHARAAFDSVERCDAEWNDASESDRGNDKVFVYKLQGPRAREGEVTGGL